MEIILVDDGSPDDCPIICDEWAKKDDRIVVVHKVNGGLSDARNNGLELAKGDYILFVDSDDYVDSKMIEKLYFQLKKTDSDICVCSFLYVDINGNPLDRLNNDNPIKNEVLL